MAHGSRKWIYAIDVSGGRVKRSRHRTYDDRLGRLSRASEFRRHDRWREMAWLRHAPKFYRRLEQRKFRACVRDIMRHGRYDDLPSRGPRDAAWSYW
jgi:hypothetical protein